MTRARYRDSSRSAVYAIEDGVFDETLFSEPIGAAGVLDLAALVAADDWWGANGRPFRVVPARRESGHSSARTVPAGDGSAQIRLSIHQENAATLAHELAHVLAADHGAATAHGPEFCAAELDVVAVVCGTIAAGRLARGFREGGIALAERTWAAPQQCSERGLFGLMRTRRQTNSPTSPAGDVTVPGGPPGWPATR